jgi:hypothetical protein
VVWKWTSICESTSQATNVSACSQSSELHRSGITCQSRLTVTGVVSDLSQHAGSVSSLSELAQACAAGAWVPRAEPCSACPVRSVPVVTVLPPMRAGLPGAASGRWHSSRRKLGTPQRPC